MDEKERIARANKDMILFLRKQAEREVNGMNPVLKRFLKGFGAYLLGTLITAFFTYTLHWLQINPMVFGSSTGIIATLLLTGEKAIPQNM